VLFRKRFWDEAPKEKRLRRKGGFSVFSDRVSDFCFDSTYLQDRPGGILCSYAIGDKADDIASEPDVMQVGRWIAKDVCDAIGKKGKAPEVLAVQQQAWQRQNWISGAYAFYRPGQWFDLQPVLAAPFERVFFAGEHIADAQGFMEGAVQTGQDAVDAMHQRYGK
jgi:monoamine oxidase